MNKSRKDMILRLRSAYGYSVRDAQKAVEDMLNTLRDLIEDLEVGESLSLEHIGRLQLCARQWRSGRSHRIRFLPSCMMAAQLRARGAMDDEPRHPATSTGHPPSPAGE